MKSDRIPMRNRFEIQFRFQVESEAICSGFEIQKENLIVRLGYNTSFHIVRIVNSQKSQFLPFRNKNGAYQLHRS